MSTNENPNHQIESIKVRALLGQAWDKLLDNYATFLLLLLIHMLRGVLAAGMVLFFTVDSPFSPFLALTTLVVMAALSYLELPSACLRIIRGQSVQLFAKPNFTLQGRWLISTLWFMLLAIPALLALVLPGLAAIILFSLYGFALIDGAGPIQALTISWNITKAVFWKLLLLWLILILTMLIFNLPVFAGLEIALDIVLTMVLAMIYDQRKELVETER